MSHTVLGLGVFVLSYCLSLLYITVFYHRCLAHKALALSPGLRRFVIRTGVWITGLDPKAWVCMHRRHHAYADTPRDPHPPGVVGIWGIPLKQLRSYEVTLACLDGGVREYTRFVPDLDFPVSRIFSRNRWFLPYAIHGVMAIAIGWVTGCWLAGLGHWLGIMSHPVQGWLVNAFGHSMGGRNFDCPDASRNNLVVALLVGGEGLQNNHHAFPASAKFSCKAGEPDLGWRWCQILELAGLATIRRESVIRGPSDRLDDTPREMLRYD